jgi:DNA-binding beta-propeller fold protein YncE
MTRLFAFLAVLAAACGPALAQPAGYHLLKKIPAAGDGPQDYLALDSAGRRLYVSHGTEVVVVDVDTDKIIGTVSGKMKGIHGIAVAPALGRGFISSGQTQSVKMFDLKTLQSLADIPAGIGPDGMVFEPGTQRVFVFNHKGESLTVIDAAAGKAIANVKLDGQPEFPVADGKGAVWDIIESKSTLIKMDAASLKILATWPLAPGEGPSALDLDLANRRLFAGCNNQVMVVLDADSGQIVAQGPIGVHVDAAVYDPKTKLVFYANRETVSVFHQDAADKYTLVGTLNNAPYHTNTLALDRQTSKIYLAGPRFEEKAGVGGGKAKRVMIPGSFTILVYGP